MAMSRRRKVILILVGVALALVLLTVIGVALLISAVRGNEPNIRDNSVLSLKIRGSMPDYVPEDPVRKILGGDDASLSNLLLQTQESES